MPKYAVNFRFLHLSRKCGHSFIHLELWACFMAEFIDAGNGDTFGIDSISTFAS